MEAAPFLARQPRSHYRHPLRTLTYVTLDDGNGGIIRNLNNEGVAVQAVAPLHPGRRVRLCFELRHPRLRIEAYGQVCWATPTGQCGIRFVEMRPRTRQQIDQWIFSELLEGAALETADSRSMFVSPNIRRLIDRQTHDHGLTALFKHRPAIRPEPDTGESLMDATDDGKASFSEYLRNAAAMFAPVMNWSSRGLSERALAWMVDSLIVLAGLLLFTFTFLSVAHEIPQWPLSACAGVAAVVFVASAYRTLIVLSGGASLGVRLVQVASDLGDRREADESDRFR